MKKALLGQVRYCCRQVDDITRTEVKNYKQLVWLYGYAQLCLGQIDAYMYVLALHGLDCTQLIDSREELLDKIRQLEDELYG